MKVLNFKSISNEKNFNYLKTLWREVLAEFIATFMLLLVGCSAGVALQSNPNAKDNFETNAFTINICWGFGAFIGIACSFNITGGHINPAVTIALASIRRFDVKKVIPYILAQLLGAITGSAIAYFIYIDVIKLQNDNILIKNDTRLITYGHKLSTGKFFATYPADHMTSLFGSIFDQVVGTASLLFAVMTITDQKNLNIPKAMQPFILAFVICVHAIAFGFNEGAPLNPARDLGPRIFSSWVVYGKEAFTALDGNYWWSGGILGPIIGAIIGVWVYFFFIEYPTPTENINNNSNVETPHKRKINSIIDYSLSGNNGINRINGRNSINGDLEPNIFNHFMKV